MDSHLAFLWMVTNFILPMLLTLPSFGALNLQSVVYLISVALHHMEIQITILINMCNTVYLIMDFVHELYPVCQSTAFVHDLTCQAELI